MAIRATKDSSFAISNVYEQEVADTDWVIVAPKLEHKPLTLDLGGDVLKPIESTATSLVSYGDTGLITTGDYVKTYSTTDGVIAGAVGTTTTTTTGTTGTHNIFADASAVATYNLDGNALDLGGTYNGTATNVTYGTGKFGQAGVFNGTNSSITLPITDWNIVTISFWIKANVTSSNMSVASDGNLNRNCIFINKNHVTDGRVPLNSISYFDSSYANSVSVSWEDNAWINVCFILNGQTMSAYKNGVFGETTTITGRPTTISSYALGRNSTLGYFDGSIDQVRIFNRALTAGEVTTLYNEQVTKYTSDITALGLTTAPTKAWLGDTKLSTVIETTANRCQAQDIPLTVTGTPTTTTATGTSTISGLLTTGDTVKLDANLVTTSGVVETEIQDNVHDIFGDASAVATYNLDGNATDLGGTYNGTATNVTYGTGKFGQAGVFNGTSSQINTGYKTSNSGNTYTISAWVKRNSFVDPMAIYAETNTTTNSYGAAILFWESSYLPNTIFASHYNSGGAHNGIEVDITPYVSSVSDWAHICFTRENGVSQNIYINGVLAATSTCLSISATSTFVGKIGSNPDYTGTDRTMDGSIDQVRIFNRALTAGEVTSLYNEQVTKYQYALTYPTQGVAPTTITVPNRAEESTVATETYDTVNDKLIKTYNDIPQSGRFLKYRLDGDLDHTVQKVQLDLFKGAI